MQTNLTTAGARPAFSTTQSRQVLTSEQAKAVYSAVCALNNAGVARFSAVIPGKDSEGRTTSTEVVGYMHGDLVVECSGHLCDRREHHVSHSAFADAYGLQVSA